MREEELAKNLANLSMKQVHLAFRHLYRPETKEVPLELKHLSLQEWMSLAFALEVLMLEKERSSVQ